MSNIAKIFEKIISSWASEVFADNICDIFNNRIVVVRNIGVLIIDDLSSAKEFDRATDEFLIICAYLE